MCLGSAIVGGHLELQDGSISPHVRNASGPRCWPKLRMGAEIRMGHADPTRYESLSGGCAKARCADERHMRACCAVSPLRARALKKGSWVWRSRLQRRRPSPLQFRGGARALGRPPTRAPLPLPPVHRAVGPAAGPLAAGCAPLGALPRPLPGHAHRHDAALAGTCEAGPFDAPITCEPCVRDHAQ